MTVTEYLAFERAAEWRHEYDAGELLPRPDARIAHTIIKDNLIGAIGGQLKGSGYRTLSSTQRVRLNDGRAYAYPDLLILKLPFQEDPDDRDTLTNPHAVIEILSPETERYDRGRKFQHYRATPALQEYILVDQDELFLQRFVRQPDESWLMHEFADPAGDFTLATLPVRVALADIYRQVDLPETPAE